MKNLYLFLGCLVLLTGSSRYTSKQAPAPVYGRSHSARPLASTLTTTLERTQTVIVEDKPAILQQKELQQQTIQSTHHVVVALLSDAESSYQGGRLDESVSIIERALRIEPRNPLLLYKLAVIRLQQGQPELAENLAKKSELLAVGNRQLKKKNWLLIAEVRMQLGDLQGAEKARNKAQKY